VGSLNWVYTKCALNKAEADVHEADIQGSTGENGDTEAASTDQWSLYNCVLDSIWIASSHSRSRGNCMNKSISV